MKDIEILAPAGNMQSLTAAVRCGADAVYLGTENFNARRNASNFSPDELKTAIKYCHLRGVKVYIALNTIVSDDELNNAIDVIKCGCTDGADALILQDLGLALIAKQIAPEMPIHASTQMSVQTVSGLFLLKELGFERAILPREMSFDEVKNLCGNSPIDLEVFVHGALCMSVSGQCYMSAMLGGRSGNRGLCAQPCRLPFKVQNGTGNDLSLKDLSIIEYLKDLAEIGVKSFKIEGRMKRPEYVAAAVTACRQSLSGQLDDELKTNLCSVFSRSGFTDGYYNGKLGLNMFGTRQKDDVISASPVLSQLSELYKNENPHIGVNFEFKANINEAVKLKASTDKITIEKVSEHIVQKALNLPLSEDKVISQLKKCGGTPFFTESISIQLDDDINVPLSVINSLRRDVLTELEEKLSFSEPKEFINKSFDSTPHNADNLKTFARFADVNQIPDDLSYISRVILPLDTKANFISLLCEKGIEVGVEIPRGIFGDEEKIKKLLASAKDNGAKFALAGTIDSIKLAKEAGLKVMGGYSLNIYNSQAINTLDNLGVEDTVLSIELTLQKAAKLGGKLNRGLIVYGNIPLMLTRNCPMKNGTCCNECSQHGVLTDRMGIDFPIACQSGCSEILNSRPIYMADKLNDIKNMDFLLLYFTKEEKHECQQIINAYKDGSPSTVEFTRGLYYRGVE